MVVITGTIASGTPASTVAVASGGTVTVATVNIISDTTAWTNLTAAFANVVYATISPNLFGSFSPISHTTSTQAPFTGTYTVGFPNGLGTLTAAAANATIISICAYPTAGQTATIIVTGLK